MIWTDKEREALLHEAVREFAEAGWVPGATGMTHGIRWRWSREGSKYVLYGVIVAAHRADLATIADPDIVERLSPEDVRRICATKAR